MDILITGDSHLAALSRALSGDQDLAQGHELSIYPLGNAESAHNPYFKDGDDCIEITLERFQLHTDRLPPRGEFPDVVAISMLFHTLRFLRQAKLWSNFAPSSLEKTDCHTITRATFKQMVLEQQKYNLEMVQTLQKYVPKVVAVEGPRVFSHHVMFEKNDQQVLLEADKWYREIMRAELDKLKIPVIDCPTEAYSAQTGLMKPLYRTKRDGDFHHASSEFGGLVLKKLVAFLESAEPNRLH